MLHTECIPFFSILLLFAPGCAPISEAKKKEHPHFSYSEAFYYHWAPGTPGPVGTNYIFKFIPTMKETPEFKKVEIKGSSEKPDIRSNGDTLVLMVQKSGAKREAFEGKGAAKEEEQEKKDGKAADSATVHYTLNGEPYRFEVEQIPKKDRTTMFE